jgi:uncharacterized protein
MTSGPKRGRRRSGHNGIMPNTPAVGSRDRDATGRARNARPRDELGRPLPYGSDDFARQPEGVVRTPDETIAQAQRLLDAGLPFHAHEVFEDAWKSSTGADRDLWKGCAQLAVGLTHLGRGNLRGAKTLLGRGSAAIGGFAAEDAQSAVVAYGIDIAGLLRWSSELIGRIEPGAAAVAWTAPVLRGMPPTVVLTPPSGAGTRPDA